MPDPQMQVLLDQEFNEMDKRRNQKALLPPKLQESLERERMKLLHLPQKTEVYQLPISVKSRATIQN